MTEYFNNFYSPGSTFITDQYRKKGAYKMKIGEWVNGKRHMSFT